MVILDVFGVTGKYSLTYRAASLTLVLEGLLVVAVLIVAIMGTQLPPSLIFDRITPTALMIAVLGLAGLWLISKARNGLPWHEQGNAPNSQEEERGVSKQVKAKQIQDKGVSLGKTALIFVIASLVTLVGGVVLEQSGDAIAQHLGISGVLFGATFLAAATSLLKVSTGLASVKLQDYKLAVSDTFSRIRIYCGEQLRQKFL